jgi:inosine-uridine nucleoside N-ribohydrolase
MRNSKPMSATRRDFLASSAVAIAGSLTEAFTGLAATVNTENSQPLYIGAPKDSAAHRVIIDTDPGVDDALAVLLAFRSPELKVEALTPVAGNVPLEFTLPNALRLVEIAGRTDVPVAAGASAPLTRRLVTAAYAHGENGFGGVEFPAPKIKPVAETAPELIRRLVRSSPGEISIIAIGPLTNVALALRLDPELAKMIRSIVLMGGSLSGGNVTPSAEFNLYVDPEAARMVFHSGIPVTMVGLDVTRKVQLREEHIQAIEAANNPSSQAAGRILRSTMNRIRKLNPAATAGPTMHDSLAASVLIDPDILKSQDYFIDVETQGEITAGETVGYRRGPLRRSAPLEIGTTPLFGQKLERDIAAAAADTFHPNAKVAMEVDAERFFQLLVGRLTGSSA